MMTKVHSSIDVCLLLFNFEQGKGTLNYFSQRKMSGKRGRETPRIEVVEVSFEHTPVLLEEARCPREEIGAGNEGEPPLRQLAVDRPLSVYIGWLRYDCKTPLQYKTLTLFFQHGLVCRKICAAFFELVFLLGGKGWNNCWGSDPSLKTKTVEQRKVAVEALAHFVLKTQEPIRERQVKFFCQEPFVPAPETRGFELHRLEAWLDWEEKFEGFEALCDNFFASFPLGAQRAYQYAKQTKAKMLWSTNCYPLSQNPIVDEHIYFLVNKLLCLLATVAELKEIRLQREREVPEDVEGLDPTVISDLCFHCGEPLCNEAQEPDPRDPNLPEPPTQVET